VRAVERPQAVDGLAGQRAGGDVAAEDDRVGPDVLELGEDRLQGRKVAVDVVEGSDAQGGMP
jgi:hypothetical protein